MQHKHWQLGFLGHWWPSGALVSPCCCCCRLARFNSLKSFQELWRQLSGRFANPPKIQLLQPPKKFTLSPVTPWETDGDHLADAPTLLHNYRSPANADGGGLDGTIALLICVKDEARRQLRFPGWKFFLFAVRYYCPIWSRSNQRQYLIAEILKNSRNNRPIVFNDGSTNK